MANNSTGEQRGSWLDRAMDKIKPQPAPPHAPAPPPVDKAQWEHSVEAHKVSKLTIHDVGLIVFQKTKSHQDSDNANDSLASAREKVAHTVINADDRYGSKPQHMTHTASPIEPSGKALQDPRMRAAYQSSLAAARDAYLSLDDPTHGATHFNFRPTPDRSNFRFKGGTPEGLPLKTQSGPFVNSFLKGDVHSRHVWIDTYGP